MSVWIGQAWCHIGPYAKFSWSFATDDWPLGQDVNSIGPDLKPTFASNSIQFDKLLSYLHVRGKLANFSSAGWRSEKMGVLTVKEEFANGHIIVKQYWTV